MSRLTRDGTAEPVSRDQIPRHARGQGNILFPVQLTTSRIGNLTRLIHTLLYVMTIHTYIHTSLDPNVSPLFFTIHEIRHLTLTTHPRACRVMYVVYCPTALLSYINYYTFLILYRIKTDHAPCCVHFGLDLFHSSAPNVML